MGELLQAQENEVDSPLEFVAHLFFLCHKVMPLWWEFNSWVKEPRVFHCRPMDNFLQHSPMAGLKDTNTRWKIWWIAATTSIWKLRNDIIFNNHPFVISKLVDNTIFLSWSWMRGGKRILMFLFTNGPHLWLWLLSSVCVVGLGCIVFVGLMDSFNCLSVPGDLTSCGFL